MKTLNWNETTPSKDIVEAAEREDVVLMRDGHAVALVVPFDDDDLDWYARERDPAFLASIARAREQVEQGRTISQNELKKQVGMP
jgi:PHD/YefM family antitoxin component YafN of YafNO toxin-antitoxin module